MFVIQTGEEEFVAAPSVSGLLGGQSSTRELGEEIEDWTGETEFEGSFFIKTLKPKDLLNRNPRSLK